MVALSWIKGTNSKEFKQFVQNRVVEIRKLAQESSIRLEVCYLQKLNYGGMYTEKSLNGLKTTKILPLLKVRKKSNPSQRAQLACQEIIRERFTDGTV